MKYFNEIVINAPRDRVIELFDNMDNLKEWQEGFQSARHLSGESGKPGAQTELHYINGKRDVRLIETITVRNLPDEFSGTYETKGMFCEVRNYFTEIDKNTTKYRSESSFKLSGFLKIMGFLMPGSFKKQSMKYLIAFKSFAENNK